MNGRCFCNSVQYRLTGEIQSAAHCHCDSCRRAGSAAFVTWMTIRAADLMIERGAESLTRYESSPGAFRSFCRTCGSQLLMEYRSEPDVVYVTMASLVSAPDKMPDRHYSYEEHPAWFALDDGLPRLRSKTTEPT